jgi:hypothetical protein
MILGNLAYNHLFQDKLLWQTGGFLAEHPVLDISTIVVLYVSTVILFLTFYSRIDTKPKKAGYILLWVLIYSAMEFVSHITGHFSYGNGWCFFYSVAFNLIMFPVLGLHHEKPLYAWLVGTMLAYIMMILFNIPL